MSAIKKLQGVYEEGYSIVASKVTFDTSISPMARLLYVILSDFAGGKEKRIAFPSRKTLLLAENTCDFSHEMIGDIF